MTSAIKPVTRRFKRHYGASAKRVTVRSQRPWYWRPTVAVLLVFMGYFICYWQLAAGDFGNLTNRMERIRQENQSLRVQAVHSERQLQVERAAQNNLAKELARLQDEDMRLKEDVAFYKSILNENQGKSELKLHNFKVSKGARPNQYNYRVFLLQSGRHDKTVQGSLKLTLSATQAGNQVILPLGDDASAERAIKMNFKYYQQLDGSFTVPSNVVGHTVEASFIENGANQPKISQRVDLPG